jgi:uncharacterized protein (DUF1697 family)
MARFVALLRGINVGKNKRIPMAELRALLEGLGCTEVATLLNSGNAVFDTVGGTAAAHAQRIAAEIRADFDFDVPVIVKTAAELRAIVADDPLRVPPAEHARMLAIFGQDARALAGLHALEPMIVPPERLALGRRAGYLWCARGILESKAGAALLGKLGQSVTTRNWATVLKLEQLLEPGTD